jgi:integrase
VAHVEQYEQGFAVRWTERGRRRTWGGIRSRREAEAIAADIERALARGESVQRESRASPSWGDAVGDYMAWYRERRAVRSAEATASRLDTAETHLRPARGTLYLDHVDIEAIEVLHTRLLGAGYAPSYAAGVCAAAATMQRWAARRPRWRGLLTELPRLDLGGTVPQEEVRAPTWAECDRAISHASGWVRRLMMVQRATGLRSAQVMHLRWDHVDLGAATFRIPPGLVGSKSKRERKHGRWVPVPRWLAAEMATWGRREGYIVDRSEAAGDPRQVRGTTRNTHATSTRPPWTRAGLEVAQPTHALRKAHVTELRLLGAPRDVIDFLQGRDDGTLQTTAYTDWLRLEPLIRPVVEMVAPYAPSVPEVVDLDAARRAVE